MSFLAWRAVHDRLSIDDKITMFDVYLPSACSFYNASGMNNNGEAIDHIFCGGQFAQTIWSYFIGPLGIRLRNVNMRPDP